MKSHSNIFSSDWILETLSELRVATLDDVWSFVHKRHDSNKDQVRERLYYLESTGRVSAVGLILGSTLRKLYCLPKNEDHVRKLVETVSNEIISILEQRLVVVTPELLESSKNKFGDTSIGLIRIVLNSLVDRCEVARLPFLTIKNTVAYFYFLKTKTSIIENHLCNLMQYFNKKKYSNATVASRELGIEVKETSYFLRHLADLGHLNMMVAGYIPEYRRCIYIFYIPGYREVVENRQQIERERWYIDHFTAVYEFLASQMKIENKSGVIENSCKVLQLCIQKGLSRGRDLDVLAIGSFIISLRNLNISASVIEVLKHLKVMDFKHVSEHNVLAIEKIIAQTLDMKLHHFPDLMRYIDKFVSGLSIPEKEKPILMEKSMKVFSSIPQKFIVGKKPSTIAAATIYVAAIALQKVMKYGVRLITQKELSIVANVSEVSIRNYYPAIEGFYNESKGSELSADGNSGN